MARFRICIDEPANQEEDTLSEIRKAITDSLELNRYPARGSLLDSLRSSLPQPHVMGSVYRNLWVDESGRSFFIIIATFKAGAWGGVGKHVLVWAIRKVDTLRDICMDLVMKRLRGSKEVESLEIPKTLQTDLIEAFERGEE